MGEVESQGVMACRSTDISWEMSSNGIPMAAKKSSSLAGNVCRAYGAVDESDSTGRMAAGDGENAARRLGTDGLPFHLYGL